MESTRAAPSVASPPRVDHVKQRVEMMRDVVSLSMDHLHDLRVLWHCSNPACDKSLKKGGFKFADANTELHILLCGHYLCSPCRRLIKFKRKKYQCEECCEGEKTGDQMSFSYYSDEEWNRLVPAPHINWALQLLARCGIECTLCKNAGYVDEIAQNYRRSFFLPPSVAYRHPIDAIVYCGHCHHRNQFASYEEPHEEDLEKHLMCRHCAAACVHGEKHRMELWPVRKSTMHAAWLKRIEARDVKMTEMERDLYADRPWNLVMMSREEMGTLCDKMLRCGDCTKPYVISEDASYDDYRPPRFLPCGHVLCLQCMQRRKAGGALKCFTRGCTIPRDRQAVENVPRDFKKALTLPLEDFRACSHCKRFHPLNQTHVYNKTAHRCSGCFIFPDELQPPPDVPDVPGPSHASN